MAPPSRSRLRGAASDLWNDESGAVTVEFALVLPVCVAVLGLMIGGVALAAHRVGLVSVAGEAARLEARGDGDGARSVLEQRGIPPDSATRETRGYLRCITLSSAPGSGPLAAIRITATACAAAT